MLRDELPSASADGDGAISQQQLAEHILLLTEVINCMGAGFFAFDPTGTCLPIHSGSCHDLVGVNPRFRKISRQL